jgi:hypothetical protein
LPLLILNNTLHPSSAFLLFLLILLPLLLTLPSAPPTPNPGQGSSRKGRQAWMCTTFSWTLAKQMLHHFSHSTSPVLYWVFLRYGLSNYWPALALKLDSSDLCLPSR